MTESELIEKAEKAVDRFWQHTKHMGDMGDESYHLALDIRECIDLLIKDRSEAVSNFAEQCDLINALHRENSQLRKDRAILRRFGQERALAAEGLAWELWDRLSELVGDPEAVAAGIDAVLLTDEQKACFERLREVMAGNI